MVPRNMELFSEFNILSSLKTTLAENHLRTPTEIQARIIPLLLEGQSVVGVSETGSGKTLAFVLPILHTLKFIENGGDAVSVPGQPRAAIITPTRDLGEQVSRVFKLFTHATKLRVRTVLGGSKMEVAKKNVEGPFEVLVATPGRLTQLMNQNRISLKDVRILIFDEADQMLDAGFLPAANKIAADCDPNRQLGLFSATVSPAVQTFITSLFSGAQVIRSGRSEKLVPTLNTENRMVPDGKRFPVMESILQESVAGGTLVFTNTREQCDEVADLLRKSGKSCLVYRGEMDKVERRANLKAFREGKVGLLVSTDLASRGLDVDHVGRVINYHLPSDPHNYIHRVGRTARAGRKGTVINLVTPRDRALMDKLQQLQNSKI